MSSITDSFIIKLINSTDSNLLKWKGFDLFSQNLQVIDYIEPFNPDVFGLTKKVLIDKSKSYFTTYKYGYIFLFVQYNETSKDKLGYVIAIQNDPSTKVVELNSTKDYQPDLIRLSNLIERQVNKVSDFINNFLDDDLT